MTTIQQPHPDSTRIEGYDAARALAILGMMIVNFKLVMGSTQDTGGLAFLTGLLEGRAAALFVLLAGVGLTLLSRRTALSSDDQARRTARISILKRAGFLMVLGLGLSLIWPPDIMRFYGVYLTISAAFLFAPDRWLLWGAGASVVGFVGLFFILDYGTGWDWSTLTITDGWTPMGMIRSLLYNGFHPALPWAAFLLVGMWLGRQDVTNPVFRRRMMGVSIGALILAEVASLALIGMTTPALGAETAALLFGREVLPPMPLYVLSAGSSALLVIMVMIELGRHLQGGWLWRVLVTTGQLALTLYLSHILIGMGLIAALGWLNSGQSLALAVSYAVGFYAIGAVFAVWWRRKQAQGPLESLMRRLTR